MNRLLLLAAMIFASFVSQAQIFAHNQLEVHGNVSRLRVQVINSMATVIPPDTSSILLRSNGKGVLISENTKNQKSFIYEVVLDSAIIRHYPIPKLQDSLGTGHTTRPKSQLIFQPDVVMERNARGQILNTCLWEDTVNCTDYTYWENGELQSKHYTFVFSPGDTSHSIWKYDTLGNEVLRQSYYNNELTNESRSTYLEGTHLPTSYCSSWGVPVINEEYVKTTFDYQFDINGNWIKRVCAIEGRIVEIVERRIYYERTIKKYFSSYNGCQQFSTELYFPDYTVIYDCSKKERSN